MKRTRNAPTALLSSCRRELHVSLLGSILQIDTKGVPSVADKDSESSIEFASGMVERMGGAAPGSRANAQSSGQSFEVLVETFIRSTFLKLKHLRPGTWTVKRNGAIALADQYSHLKDIEDAARANPAIKTLLGLNYIIKPDILILRDREPDSVINRPSSVVDASCATASSLRTLAGESPILHACVSCKWTLRSDRAQNARSEGLSLIRQRKGRLSHVVVVTAEPMPGRLASLALGTGEIDHVYHAALYELSAAVEASDRDDSKDLLKTMIEGNRLRDISDLPLDFAQ